MTDRELLEAAAKAAGIVVIRSRLDDPLKRDMLIDLRPDAQPKGWNPLTDDGDALRLAVRLYSRGFQLHGGSGGVCVDVGHPLTKADEWCDPGAKSFDPYAATRRAIVRAAAASVTQLDRK